MKSFEQIQNEKLPGDFEIIAEATGQSPETIKKKVQGARTDTHNTVRKAFNILLTHREKTKKMIVRMIKQELKAHES